MCFEIWVKAEAVSAASAVGAPRCSVSPIRGAVCLRESEMLQDNRVMAGLAPGALNTQGQGQGVGMFLTVT